MTPCNTLNVKLSNSQLNKLKSGIKIGTEITLYILKKHREKTDNASIRIYINKIANRITFKIKTDNISPTFNF